MNRFFAAGLLALSSALPAFAASAHAELSWDAYAWVYAAPVPHRPGLYFYCKKGYPEGPKGHVHCIEDEFLYHDLGPAPMLSPQQMLDKKIPHDTLPRGECVEAVGVLPTFQDGGKGGVRVDDNVLIVPYRVEHPCTKR